MTAIASTDLIAEIESVVKAGPPERRIRLFRRVTNLFLADADRLSEDQIGVFDDILVRLMENAEARTLTKLSAPLADLKSAPREVIRRLAHHEDATVAAPILLKCECLSDHELATIASERGEKHLSAIAKRSTLSCTVTDILLSANDTGICGILAKNPGARFSNLGFSRLTDAAARDDEIAYALVCRPDLPVAALRDLVAKCTPALQSRVVKVAPPDLHQAIHAAIDELAARARERKAEPVDYSEAKATVLALNNSGRLNDSMLHRFAMRREHRNIIAALSLLASVPTEKIEPLLEAQDCQGLVVACRASRLNWNTTAALIRNRETGNSLSTKDLEWAKEIFETLSLSAAQRAIRFGSIADRIPRPSSPETPSELEVH
jgi:uncharacterized protein (DUF2336 family)